MPTEKNLSNLIINKVESKAVYDYMTANNLVNEDELYFISGDDEVQIVVDSELNATSENPVQNKIVTAAITNLNTLVGDTSVSTQIDTAIASKADASDLNAHIGNSTIHITSTERTNWNAAKTHADSAHAPSNAEANQNAFSNIIVGGTTIAADSKTDTLTIVAGNNVTLTPDATNDKLTIAAKDTVYTHPTYTARGAGLYKVTVDGTGHVSEATSVIKDDIVALGIPAQDTTYNEATTSAAGLMSASDKTKLNGIAEGANKTVVDTALSSTSTNPVQNKAVNTAISNLNTLVGDTSVASQISTAVANKVDKVDGKGLSTNDYTTDEKNKLSGIATGAEVNQNAFSNVVVGSTTIAADSKTDSLTIVAGNNITITPDATNDKLTIAATDTVYTHPTYTSKSSGLYKVTVDGTGHVSAATAVAKSDITALGIPAQDTTYSTATQSANGLMSSGDKTKLDGIETGANKTVVDSALSSTSTNPVQNKAVNTAISNLNTLVGDKSVSSQITSAIDALNLSSTYIAATQKGAVNGVAELDSNGKVPSTQLPSYVDDVLEYSAKSGFPSTGETGKIYVDTSTNLTYRWSGSAYVEISPSIALGTTSSTAFRGDYGNTAYTHATAKGSAFASGLYKITTNDQGHVTAATAVAKSDITGLGIPAQDTTYTAATTSAAGLMSAADKTKLDGIATGATKVTVDSALSTTSTNPVQNKVVATSINNLNTLVGDKSVATQISTAIANKVDKEDGKGLSTNDYTTEEKEKLASIGEWAQLYDSGETTAEVNSFSGIDITGYKNLMVAIKCVNTTNTASTRAGAVYFTGSNSQDYAFNNIFSNLLKNGTTTSGAMAKFRIIDGFIICETAMRAITADGILSDTEGAGFDTLAPVSSGLVRCTNTITTMAVTTAGQSATHYYGAGSRVIVWGCKA